jgi:sigma-E factor negative regulatory protein RseB
MLRRLFVAALSVATAFTALEGRAATAAASAAATAPDTAAWLERVHQAASERNYQGMQVFAAGGSVSSSHIAHYCTGHEQFERVDMLDGQLRQVLRHDDMVYTVWPQRQLAVVEQRELLSPFPALLPARASMRLGDFYELSPEGRDRVADHEAEVFLLRPRDALRYAQRLWTERDSGLLLRADVLGPHGEVLESSAFSDVAIGVKPQPAVVLLPLKQLQGYRVVHPAVTHTRLEQQGWALKHAVPGFEEISCVRRALDPLAPLGSPAHVETLQAIYTDGLTHVSLFIEPYDPQRHPHAMHSAVGATHTLMGREGSSWITIVGDVPLGTLKQFAATLERRD